MARCTERWQWGEGQRIRANQLQPTFESRERFPRRKGGVNRSEDRNLLQGTAHELFALENGSHGDEQVMGGVRFDDVTMSARMECGFRNVGMAVFGQEQ